MKKEGATSLHRHPAPSKLVIGAAEQVDFPELEWHGVSARVDTGAATSSIHCSKVRLSKNGEKQVLQFFLDAHRGAPARSFSVTSFKETLVKNSFGQIERRYVIKTQIVVQGKKIRAEFSLANRKEMRFPVLLGRKLLKGRFLVDVSLKSLSH